MPDTNLPGVTLPTGGADPRIAQTALDVALQVRPDLGAPPAPAVTPIPPMYRKVVAPGPPVGPSPSPLSGVGDAVGNILGAVGGLLDKPREGYESLLAAGVTGPFRRFQKPGRPERIEAAQATGDPEKLRDALLLGTPVDNVVGRFAEEAVTDPLTYAGAGLPGKLTRFVAMPVAERLGPAAMSRVTAATIFLNKADKAVAEAPWKALSAGTRGTLRTVGKLPLAVGGKGPFSITVEGGGTKTAESLGELLGSPNRRTLFKRHVANLTDMVGTLLRSGRDLERDIGESGALRYPAYPGSQQRASRYLGNAQRALLDTFRQLDSPGAKVVGVEILDHVEQAVDTAMRQADAVLRQYGGDLQAVTGAARKPVDDAFRVAYDDALSAIQAGHVVMRRIRDRARGLVTDPQMAARVEAATSQLLNDVGSIGRESGQRYSAQAEFLSGRAKQQVLGPDGPGQQIAQTAQDLGQQVSRATTPTPSGPLSEFMQAATSSPELRQKAIRGMERLRGRAANYLANNLPTNPEWLAKRSLAESRLVALGGQGDLDVAAQDLAAARKFWPQYGGPERAPEMGKFIQDAEDALSEAQRLTGGDIPAPTVIPGASSAPITQAARATDDTLAGVSRATGRRVPTDAQGRAQFKVQLGENEPPVPVLPSWVIAADATRDIRTAIQGFRDAVGVQLKGLPDLSRELSDVTGEAGLVAQGLPNFAASLPSRFEGLAQKEAPELINRFDQIVRDRRTITQALTDLWTTRRPNAPLPVPFPDNYTVAQSGAWADAAQAILDGLGLPLKLDPQSPLVSLLQSGPVRQMLSPRVTNRLEEIASRWPGGDVLTENPYRLAVDALARAYAKQYNIGQGGLTDALDTLTGLWKENAVLTPSYGAINTLGALVMGALNDVDPRKVVRMLGENVGDAWHDRPVINSSLRVLQTALDFVVPEKVTASAGFLTDLSATKEFLKTGITVSGRVGAGKLAVGGGALGAVNGAVTPADSGEERAANIAKGAATGATLGAVMPTVSKYYLSRIMAGVEATVRQAAFEDELIRRLAPQTDALLARVQQALQTTTRLAADKPGSGGRLRQTLTLRVPPATQQAVVGQVGQQVTQAIARRGGMVSPAWLHTTLLEAGVPEAAARGAAKFWQDQIDAAVQAGTTFAGKVHVDYHELSNFDQFMATAFPFSTWALKITPTFLENVLTRPSVLFSLISLNEVSNDVAKKEGLTQRFDGGVPIGLGDIVWSALVGRPVQAWFNPLRGISPFADSGRTLSNAQYDESPLAAGLDYVSALGPSPHFLLQMALRGSGLLGDEPASGLLRLGGVSKALTGVDLNAAQVAGEQRLRTVLSGREPTDLDTVATEKRVDELALQRLGHPARSEDPASGPYLQAKVTHAGPIWEEAQAQVGRERGARSIAGFLAAPLNPQALLTPEEAQIRAARRTTEEGGTRVVLDPGVSEALRAGMEQGRGAVPVTPDVQAEVAQAARQVLGDPLPRQVQLLLDIGTVAALSQVSSMVSQAQVAQNPLIAGYSGAGSPEEVKLQNLLSLYNAPGQLIPGLDPAQAEAVTAAYNAMRSAPPWMASRMRADTSPTGRLLQQALDARDAFRAANPLLDQYLNYLAAQGGQGSKAGFLDTR